MLVGSSPRAVGPRSWPCGSRATEPRPRCPWPGPAAARGTWPATGRGSSGPTGYPGYPDIRDIRDIRNQDQGWGYQVLSLISLIQHSFPTPPHLADLSPRRLAMALVPMVSRSCELLVVTATDSDSLVVASTRISSWDGNIDGPKGPVCAEVAIRVVVTRAQLRLRTGIRNS